MMELYPETKIGNLFENVIYLRILIIIENNFEYWQISLQFLKIKHEVCKIFKIIYENNTKILRKSFANKIRSLQILY